MNIQKLNDSIYAGKTDIAAAARYLQLHGYRILHSDYVTDFGKLDLVVTDDRILAIVIIVGEDSVLSSKPLYKRREDTINAAAAYIKRFILRDVEVRFDIMNISRKDKTVLYTENAFDSYLNY